MNKQSTTKRPSSAQTVTVLKHARANGLTVDVNSLPEEVNVLEHLQVATAMDGWTMGRAPLFWKSGGPALDRPLFHAPLPAQGVWHQTASQTPVRLTQPVCTLYGVEAEIAFRIGQNIDRAQALTLDLMSVHAVVDAMTVSLEWVDSRWQQQLSSPLPWLQVDRLSHGALVLGDTWLPYIPRDWSQQICHVDLPGQERETFQGSHPLGDPSHVLLPWLLHATEHWGVVEAGTVVTSGSWCQILYAQAGDVVRVAFDGIGEASLQFAAA